MNKNDIVIKGDVTPAGDFSVGNTIENQTNNIYNYDINLLEEYLKKDNALTLAQQQLVAEDKARQILSEFSEKILPKLVKAEMVNAFSDPAIQIFFRQEQKTAICSSRKSDLDILSEMLIYRIKNKQSIEKKASISKAIDVIDIISDDSLSAMAIHYFLSFDPISRDIMEGLSVLNDKYEKILQNINLPQTNGWIDNIEILGLARVNASLKMKKMEEIYFERLEGYCVKGIKKDTEEYTNVVNKLNENNIPLDVLQDHILNPGYVRLRVINEKQVDDICLIYSQIQNNHEIKVKQKMSDEQRNVLREIYTNSKKEKDCDSLIKQNLFLRINEFDYFKKVLEWWNNNLETAVNLNSVGRIIAHTNLKGMIDDIPDMV